MKQINLNHSKYLQIEGDTIMDIPRRKSTRLKGYDYSTPGSYFITICVKNKEKLLSEIISETDINNSPQNVLTSYGNIAKKYLNQMNDYYTYLSVDKYVIMPNHIHFILTLTTDENAFSKSTSPANKIVSQFISTFKRFCNKEYGRNIWQRLSNDHIIRGDNDYNNIWEYIDTNVAKWKSDCFYK